MPRPVVGESVVVKENSFTCGKACFAADLLDNVADAAGAVAMVTELSTRAIWRS